MSELPFLSPPEVCARLGFSRMTLHRMRKAGDFPNPIMLRPKMPRWRPADIDHWIESRTAA